ncbi:hypothetical protein B0O80DRAFT_442464 [Mortierella sp. GBAus27b]|nr:hypothetical protein B0O80DRAFT_442464 [Mortierella sp. GBAus27b]
MKRERGIVLAIKHGLNNDLGLAFCPRGIQNVQTLGLHDLVNHSASIVKKGFLGGSEVRVRSKDLLIRSHGFRGGCVGDQLGGHVGAWVGSSLVLSPGVGHGGGVHTSPSPFQIRNTVDFFPGWSFSIGMLSNDLFRRPHQHHCI